MSRTFITSLLTLIVAFSMVLVACGSEEPELSNTIGISKIVTHPALDAVEQGIIDELRSLGYEDLEFDLQNANGDPTTAASIASKFRADGVRLAVGIATPTAQALASTLEDIPVIYSAVTDPVDAGLVGSFDEGEDGITGVSDLTPVQQQIAMLTEFADVDRLGHVYSSSEANAVRLAELARNAAADLGLEFVEQTVTRSAEVRSAVQSIAGRVDAIYVSNDNTVVSAIAALTSVAAQAGIPIVSADPSSAEDYEILLAFGFDYYAMGRRTGQVVAQVLEGTDPSDIPTVFMTDPAAMDLLVNLDVAQTLGITVPQDIVDSASLIVEDGELREQ